jgi:hypothetical protein
MGVRKRAIRRGLVVASTCALAMVSVSAWAADGEEEIATAAQHAELAANGSEIGDVHSHLSHVVNCLVGPDGVGFNAGAGNPCKGMGAGAIADTADPDKRSALEDALTHALSGLGSQDIMTAKDAAVRTQVTLDSVK